MEPLKSFALVSFDLDGVIASCAKTQQTKTWGRMNGLERALYKEQQLINYTQATPLLVPTGNFIICTARKQEPRVIEATFSWLKKHRIEPRAVFFLNKGRTLENVGRYKADIVLGSGAQAHIEDNKEVLKRMKKILKERVELFYFNGKTIELF